MNLDEEIVLFEGEIKRMLEGNGSQSRFARAWKSEKMFKLILKAWQR